MTRIDFYTGAADRQRVAVRLVLKALEQKRRVAWLITNQPALDNSVAAAVRRWNEGEVPAMQRELAAKGLWPPPPSWSSEAGGARTR